MDNSMSNAKKWTIDEAIHTYQIDKWSEGYFSVNEKGELMACPTKNKDESQISLIGIIEEMKKEGIQFPAVIRFHDILRSQVKTLNETFIRTIKKANFEGKYFGVYPIKVNQLREVVEEVVDIGKEYNYGLEAGSKAELLTVLAYNDNTNSLTILNGYKDKEFMQLAALGTEIGRNCIVVIENISEIYILLDVIDKMKVDVKIGVRSKLGSKSAGKWAESAGEGAKFGLSITEILDLIKILKENNKIHLLELFHFHIGSQIPDIRTIKENLTEGARIYTDLIKLGAPIKYFDAGGGVGLNYDGSRSSCPSSTNYSLDDYIDDVVYILKDICDDANVYHPNIVTETGRAISAHHSCVVTNVFGTMEMSQSKEINTNVDDNDHLMLKNIKLLLRDLNLSNYQSIYNDACILKEEAINAYKLGMIDLLERSKVETLFWNINHRIISMTENIQYIPNEIKKLKYTLASKYFCNFSVFQSTPDAWAIDQILPVVPLRRLNEKPTQPATIADITCDSDGKINQFLGAEGNGTTLPLHKLENGEFYPIGFFLTGAYQDIMGDMHNLFGRLNEVHVYEDRDDESGFYIEEVIYGQSAANVLSIMQYSPELMCLKVKAEIDKKIRSGDIKPRIGIALNDFYEATIHGYTYLDI
jgi:arginine decarboxylase